MHKRITAKKGDTLIEVLLAVGIFSMIAIAVVAVMSGGTSGAQLSLETTLTREQIDTQAEAVRFIHDSYISDKDSENQELPFILLWKKMTEERAIKLDELPPEFQDDEKAIVQYSPEKCSDLYDDSPSVTNNIFKQNAFIINTNMLGKSASFSKTSDWVDAVYKYGSNNLSPAQTYPHLTYTLTLTEAEEKAKEGLVADDSIGTFSKAEGIFVVAVKDNKTTQVVTSEDGIIKKGAFYDFYIRSCWYGSSQETPSTISTVIRLYDPDSVEIVKNS